jgi:hypothetical protein
MHIELKLIVEINTWNFCFEVVEINGGLWERSQTQYQGAEFSEHGPSAQSLFDFISVMWQSCQDKTVLSREKEVQDSFSRSTTK